MDQSKYVQILNKYKDIISSPPDLILTEDPSTGDYFVSLNIAFNPHPRYGSTRLRIREKYNSSEELYFYRYCWEMNCKPTGNISAWENEHSHGLDSDPHHHHHVPYDRKPVQNNHSIRTLEDAFKVIVHYITSGNNYP